MTQEPFVNHEVITHAISVPITKFTFNIQPDLSTLKNLEIASQRCSNYVITASTLAYLSSFITNSKDYMTRKDSRYILIFASNGSFSSETFFEDVPYFKKVLDLHLIVMSTEHRFSSTFWDAKIPRLNR